MKKLSKKDLLLFVATERNPSLLTDGEVMVQIVSGKRGYIYHEGCILKVNNLFSTLFDFYDPSFDGEYEGEEVRIDETHFKFEFIEPNFYVVKDGIYVNGVLFSGDVSFVSQFLLNSLGEFNDQNIPQAAMEALVAEFKKQNK